MSEYRKKLIEVALPLSEINDASAYDKMPGIGPHPKGIHHWWARLPLPVARVVLFASVVDDPSSDPRFVGKSEAEHNAERERLFDLIHRLTQKRLHDRPEVYAEARREMERYCGGKLPPVLDPFAGGGSIPLEANRLGFEAHAADLNPVAVLLNKCNLEVAPRWVGHVPVNRESRRRIDGTQSWQGTHGLAEDVRYYARLIRQRSLDKLGHVYPKVRLTKEHGGGEAKAIAWIWARTVASPDPAVRGAHVPLISTYWLSSKKDGLVWLKPVVNRSSNTYHFDVHTGEPPDRDAVKSGTKVGRGGFKCLFTENPIPFEHIRKEGTLGRISFRLLAVVGTLSRGKLFIPASKDQEQCAKVPELHGELETQLPEEALGFRVQNYGVRMHSQMFTPRQLTAMVVLSDLVKTVRADVIQDAVAAGLVSREAEDYANAVTTFLALSVDRCADFNNSLCRWSASNQKVMNLFGRQAVPMIWDFAEANILGDSVGAWSTCSDYVAECIEVLGACATSTGCGRQIDAASVWNGTGGLIVSTDPPYYDNIGYGALSDFFYIWLRRTIGDLYPDLFSTVLVPKVPELIASPERFDGDREKARDHFEDGFRKAFTGLRDKLDARFPLTVYYAFKQSDEEEPDEEGEQPSGGIDLTTGWETLLTSILSSGFQVTGTWPVRASQQWRMRSMGANALASYIVLVCRPRSKEATVPSRRDFLVDLKKELPEALRHLQKGNIAPVDLAQAAIGPGMAIFSRYAKVMESDGTPMRVRTALTLINQVLDEMLEAQESEFDADTRWALAWFSQHAHEPGPYGDAEQLSKAKNVGINGLVEAGILEARAGKVRLLRREELPSDWDPLQDSRLTVWETAQHLIRTLEQQGESGAAQLIAKLGGTAEIARDLAYRLYVLCERNKWAKEALAYNGLVIVWPELSKLARSAAVTVPQQFKIFAEDR